MNRLAAVRTLCPDRPLTLGESLRVAELQAARLLELSDVAAPPVPEAMIEALPRLRVVRMAGIPVSGSAHWSKGSWVVAVNRGEPRVRQRFSMSHELKHVLDAPFGPKLYPAWRGLSAEDRAEQVANYFAGCFLMPKAWVKRAAYDQGPVDAATLAERFAVSREAMRVRLSVLGMLPATVRCGVREAA